MLRAAMLSLLVLLCPAGALAEQWSTGGFSFSDELGGFTILGASGSGTDADPIVVVQRQSRAAPVTMVIRTLDRVDSKGKRKPQLFIQFSLVVVITNDSKRNWAGYDLELQEIHGKPSVYFDGLSFDQLRTFENRVFRSDKFAVFSDLTEPFDRIRFENGYVSPSETVSLKVYITDVTPERIFYLVQDPQILLAGRMRAIRQARMRSPE